MNIEKSVELEIFIVFRSWSVVVSTVYPQSNHVGTETESWYQLKLMSTINIATLFTSNWIYAQVPKLGVFVSLDTELGNALDEFFEVDLAVPVLVKYFWNNKIFSLIQYLPNLFEKYLPLFSVDFLKQIRSGISSI